VIEIVADARHALRVGRVPRALHRHPPPRTALGPPPRARSFSDAGTWTPMAVA